MCCRIFFILLIVAFDNVLIESRFSPSISSVRCEAACWKIDHKSLCMRNCRLKNDSKPGKCPDLNSTTLSPFALACLNSCKSDAQCPELMKCCQHSCGITCQHPHHLLSTKGLPDVPTDVKVSEGRRKRTIHVNWTPGGSSYLDEGGGTVLYLIQERHHSGRLLNYKKFSEWTSCAKTNKPIKIIRNLIKPGRWYQFRVAAVNFNGTKGFSEPSRVFGVSITPKPPKAPQNVTVGPLWTNNGSLNAEVRWMAPESDLPLQRYKIFWSRRLHGAKALDSVLVHQQVVQKDQKQFLLQHLEPNSLYFVQIQALVQYGKERLKGEKSGLVLNTTNLTNVTENSVTMDPNNKARVEDLHLQKLFWAQGELRARIAWQPKRGVLRYTVTWWTGPCHQAHNNFNHFKMAANTKVPQFDLNELQFNCRYRVSVREVSLQSMRYLQDTFVTFTTPKCLDFKLAQIRGLAKKIRCIDKF